MADLIDYKCLNCGGGLIFDSQSQKLKCEYCDAQFELDALKALEEDVKITNQNSAMTWDTMAGGQWQEGEEAGLKTYVCNSCGGQIIGDDTLGSVNCPYCDSPIVMKGQFAGELKPDLVIPFKLDKNAALAGYNKHIEGKKLLPKIFKDKNHIDEIKGVYVPFWLFDADVDANIRYKATKVRTWQDSQKIYTETKHFSVVRSGKIGFCNVPEDGSSKMPDDMMESIEPFNVNEAKPFTPAYLAGYMADKYDVSAEDSIDRANKRIKHSTEMEFAKTATGYASLVPESSNVMLSNGKARYALYPVWLLNTTYEGKRYYFAMNGQTGKFVGDLPVDNAAYWSYFAKFTGIFSLIAMFVFYFFVR
ncbi:MAG: hypothetical protein PUG10_12490 [Lachnospiraceae bacterium]|nr:hypothetical protein [Lachnospiraceae bacterium]